ncbi:[acyl-carrier-protein] S-malonyltransferase [Actinoalloteichus hymeniacidonis]|nr:[acyl-carrier-protein] S-malonyltransferase [Actinoalloteichus hymeniacidonis]
MGAEFAEDGVADRWFAAADEVLGLKLGELCRSGSAEELRATEIAQPAVLVASLIAWEALRGRGIEPAVVAGHSLGEYTALVTAGVLEWTDALRLVRRRGELMAAAADRNPGRMAAVLGPSSAEVESWCARVHAETGEIVAVANHNAPRQQVVSGTLAGVDAVRTLARAEGADVVLLKVSAPFHSELMRDAQTEFAADLDAVDFGVPRVPVIANATGDYVLDGAAARDALRVQLCAPVRWTATMRLLADQEIASVVEVGPGHVLTNLAGLCAPELPAVSVGSAAGLSAAVDRLHGSVALTDRHSDAAVRSAT